jgi:uncharacterized membrane protein YfcA
MVLLTSTLVVAAAVGVIAGILIGCIGVGGVILVPSLIQLPDVSASSAVPACLFSYIFGGVIGVVAYSCKGTIDWKDASVFCAAAAPAALLGAWLFHQISDFAIKITTYTLTLTTSLFSLYRAWRDGRTVPNEVAEPPGETDGASQATVVDDTSINRSPGETTDHSLPINGRNDSTEEQSTLLIIDKASNHENQLNKRRTCLQVVLKIVIGCVVGIGSALTGTSGPVILLPILICLQWDIKLALGWATQVIICKVFC